MTVRFFTAEFPPERLARVDDEPGGATEMLEAGADWRTVRSLRRLVFTDNNLDWEEVSTSSATEVEAALRAKAATAS